MVQKSTVSDPTGESRKSGEPMAGDWTVGEEQQELEGSRPPRRLGPDSRWCSLIEAAEILGVHHQRVSDLIYVEAVLRPWVAAGGRVLLRRADVHTAALLVGPPGAADRWAAAKAAVGSPGPAPRPPRKVESRARRRRSDRLPWDQISAEYTAGVSSRELAARYGIKTDTLTRQLRERGVRLAGTPMQLSLTDAELRQRHDAGETIAELAQVCRVSPATIWRHLQAGVARGGRGDHRRSGTIADIILDDLADQPDLACTINDLVEVVYGTPGTDQQRTSRRETVRRTVKDLEQHGLVTTNPRSPSDRTLLVHHR